jgi:hypothetical protein
MRKYKYIFLIRERLNFFATREFYMVYQNADSFHNVYDIINDCKMNLTVTICTHNDFLFFLEINNPIFSFLALKLCNFMPNSTEN